MLSSILYAAAYSGASQNDLLVGLASSRHFSWNVERLVRVWTHLECILTCRLSPEWTFLCALRQEKTFSQGPSREYTLRERLVHGGLSGCLPRHRWNKSQLFTLSYFCTPRLGCATFWCAQEADSPMLSTTWRRWLSRKWKSLDNERLHVWWKCNKL